MSLITWKPRNTWMDFPRWVEDFFDDDMLMTGFRNGTNLPAVNVTEDEKNFMLRSPLPEWEKKDFNIHVDNGVLTVETMKQASDEEKTENYTRKEFSFNAFKRSFWLPENVNADAIKAEYEKGLLRLFLRKKMTSKPTAMKMIEVA